jgi:protocatechuate 3,4-dioxygenase beta subunit
MGVVATFGIVAWRTAERPPHTGATARARPTPVWVVPERPATGAEDAAVIAISGTVVDSDAGTAVPGVQVVVRGARGESSTISDDRGHYAIAVVPGAYHVFVDDEAVLSTARPDDDLGEREPGVPDEAAMTIVVASGDVTGADVLVERAATITGRVTDGEGAPIAGAIVRASGGPSRPVLGSDAAEVDGDGRFVLRVGRGTYAVTASHPSYASSTNAVAAQVTDTSETLFELGVGCALSGRVVGSDGGLVGDGTVTVSRIQPDDLDAEPVELVSGPLALDGTFRIVAEADGPVEVRARPWNAPASLATTLWCHAGARVTSVVVRLPRRDASVEGRIVDAGGAPVPFASIAMRGEDGAVVRERADAAGGWAFYDLAPGHYQATSAVARRGVLVAELDVPARDVRLELAATGRIEGTAPELADGSFVLSFERCRDPDVALASDRRLVRVVDGRFEVDDVPGCPLSIHASWHERTISADLDVAPGDTATLELGVGPPRVLAIIGAVHDADGRPAAGATLTARYEGEVAASVVSDSTGHFALSTPEGAILQATLDELGGFAFVDTDGPLDLTLR